MKQRGDEFKKLDIDRTVTEDFFALNKANQIIDLFERVFCL